MAQAGKAKGAGRAKGKAGSAAETLVFEPTLLPSPFEEQSPQLCWDLELPGARVALTLAQFGWSAVILAKGDGQLGGTLAFEAGTLGELAEEIRASAQLPEEIAERLRSPWILAYERA